MEREIITTIKVFKLDYAPLPTDSIFNDGLKCLVMVTPKHAKLQEEFTSMSEALAAIKEYGESYRDYTTVIQQFVRPL